MVAVRVVPVAWVLALAVLVEAAAKPQALVVLPGAAVLGREPAELVVLPGAAAEVPVLLVRVLVVRALAVRVLVVLVAGYLLPWLVPSRPWLERWRR